MFYLRNFKKMARFDVNSNSNIAGTVDLYNSNFLSVIVRFVRIIGKVNQFFIYRGLATTVLSRGAISAKSEKWPFLEVHSN